MTVNDEQKKWIIVGAFVILVGLAAYMLKEYLGAMFVGGLVAFFLIPVNKWLQSKIKSKKTAQIILVLGSLILLLTLILAFILPLIQQTSALYLQSEDLVEDFIEETKTCTSEPVSVYCKLSYTLEGYLGEEFVKNKSQEVLEKVSLFIFQGMQGILSGAISFVIAIVITVFSIFYFIEHGLKIKENVLEMIPLQEKYKLKLLSRLQDTIKAVVGGNFIAALIQGIAGGLIFFLLGVPSPLFWGLIMAILAFIPLVGPGLIWIPAVFVFFVQNDVTRALILLAYGIIVINSIEYILKPKLIGKKIQLSSFAILLGVIGGLSVFGILGLFFGPIIIALLVTTMEIYREMS